MRIFTFIQAMYKLHVCTVNEKRLRQVVYNEVFFERLNHKCHVAHSKFQIWIYCKINVGILVCFENWTRLLLARVRKIYDSWKPYVCAIYNFLWKLKIVDWTRRESKLKRKNTRTKKKTQKRIANWAVRKSSYARTDPHITHERI